MSFILDALKKSESERNRHAGPVLMDVRVAPPRRRLPTWAWVIGVVLAANLAILGYLLWRAPAGAPASAAPTAATPAPAPAPTAGPAVSPATTAPTAPAVPTVVAAAAPSPDDLPATPPAITPPAAGSAVAVPAVAAPAPPDLAGLPSAQDLQAAGVALPELRLNWHVYDANAANRYVLLNASRLHEGESTPEGVAVEAITTAGVVLSWHGRRFFLSAGG